MRAVQLVGWQSEPELREIDEPTPGTDEVLVKVEGAGLCHSDLHVMEWPEGRLPWHLPFTLGHETAGTVAAFGSGVTAFDEGDRVAIYGPWGCGSCWHCAVGAENLCQHRGLGGCGLGINGGLAEYVLVPSARLLVPIGDLDPVNAAPLTDAGLTPYHAIKSELHRLIPGTTVLVIGVGGLGHVAVQLLRELAPARIVALDTRESARDLAIRSGASAALDPRGLDSADLRSETGRTGAILVLDFVGSDETLGVGASAVAAGGQIAMVGIGGGTLPMNAGTLPIEWSLRRPSWGTLPELHEVVALARGGSIEIEVEQIALADTVDGYRRLAKGEVNGRVVVVP